MSFWNDLSFGSKIMIVLSVCFVVWLISSYIMIRINYKALFDWWANNGGSQYDNQFNLFAMCAANYSTPLYYMSKFLASPLNQLDIPQTRFVIGQLLPFTRHVSDGVQSGVITPKSLCKTVLLSSQDNDVLFNNWFENDAQRGGLPIKEGYPLVYIPNNAGKNALGRDTYTYSLQKNTGSNSDGYGLYPDSSDRPSWCGLILEWLGDGWVMEMNDEDGLLHPVSKDGSNATTAKWFQNNGTGQDIGRADNFLARMCITPNCPLVIFYCNNYYISQENKVDTQAFVNLLSNAGSNAGGWIGFLNGFNNIGTDEYIGILDSYVQDLRPPIPPATPCTPGSAGKGVAVGFAAAAGIAAMVFAGPVGWGTVGILALAVGTGLATGIPAGSGTCKT
jgi:hypothetical protein